MSSAEGIREVGYFDCRGGGQVVVDGTTAYVGHTTGPEATTIIDVEEPGESAPARPDRLQPSGRSRP
jgi:hypothetical protein